MALDRFWKWTCDDCGTVEWREDHGLPKGWIYVKDRVITHACCECFAKVPKSKRGFPTLVAPK